MAAEKLAKAYRFHDTSTNIQTLLTSHVGFVRFLNTFLLSPKMRQEYRGRSAQLTNVRKTCEKLARAVERLAPAIDRENSPGNAEYPWEQDGQLVVPAQYSFPDIALLSEPRGRMFLKLLDRAFLEFDDGSGNEA